MARTIMDVIRDGLDQTTVANALYEIMVDWNRMTHRLAEDDCRGRNRERVKDKRWVLERTMARFLGISTAEARWLLEDHFA